MLDLIDIDFEVKKGKSRIKILDDVFFTIPKNKIIAITGPNGSGKSTLAEIIMGIKRPTSGRVIFNGGSINDKTITERAKLGIAYSFQRPVKFKGLCVYDLLNISSGELVSENEAGKYLKIVGLEPQEYLFRNLNDKLSGGELKRIEIATILARNAELIIFDEPEAGIDIWSLNNIINIFKKLRDKEKTLIIISHQEKILRIADEVLLLEKGKIIKHGKPDKILSNIRGEIQ